MHVALKGAIHNDSHEVAEMSYGPTYEWKVMTNEASVEQTWDGPVCRVFMLDGLGRELSIVLTPGEIVALKEMTALPGSRVECQGYQCQSSRRSSRFDFQGKTQANIPSVLIRSLMVEKPVFSVS